mmetsp:Transcript_1739/g.3691  ORF Transcript_1739/g.3691 Transcript_1739/m.3691 type:complete len:246 (+) Transcript_1739:243-980(+)
MHFMVRLCPFHSTKWLNCDRERAILYIAAVDPFRGGIDKNPHTTAREPTQRSWWTRTLWIALDCCHRHHVPLLSPRSDAEISWERHNKEPPQRVWQSTRPHRQWLRWHYPHACPPSNWNFEWPGGVPGWCRVDRHDDDDDDDDDDRRGKGSLLRAGGAHAILLQLYDPSICNNKIRLAFGLVILIHGAPHFISSIATYMLLFWDTNDHMLQLKVVNGSILLSSNIFLDKICKRKNNNSNTRNKHQ